jgi:AbrB family looped-hinge helix DNA binding protein
LTIVLRFATIKLMKNDVVTLSSKYQVVIPKAARQKLGLNKPEGQRFKVERVSDVEIVFRKDKSLEDYLGKYGSAFPANAAAKIRQTRDAEW